MTTTRRAWLGFGALAISLSLACLLFQLLPPTAGVTDRLVASMSLPYPLFVGGLILRAPAGALGRGSVRGLLLASAAPVLLGARQAARLLGATLSPVQEVVYFGMLLVLLSALIWFWRQTRHSSKAAYA